MTDSTCPEFWHEEPSGVRKRTSTLNSAAPCSIDEFEAKEDQRYQEEDFLVKQGGNKN